MDRVDENVDDLALSAEEYAAVHAAVTAVVRARAGDRTVTLGSLFERWSGIAEEVEEGYSWCAPEFDNDIWCRGALAGVWPLLPARVRAIRQPELDGIDERYRRATVGWPGRPEDEAGWWARRVPRRLEVEASEQREGDWPPGWAMLPFPKPDSVEVTCWA
ncbi:hypothetical protein [Streptomyces sp. SID3343]|uniref:hypothetical protein n=1 Tax=Streptomyces sp. SID3343 TaxID=2690260 RepID=UPI0013698E7A|nr:hypothetical protein [Streptomyces sp. SID3343]MYV97835.1 hypothetical protein [Streptomyces sp. SID3343]